MADIHGDLIWGPRIRTKLHVDQHVLGRHKEAGLPLQLLTHRVAVQIYSDLCHISRYSSKLQKDLIGRGRQINNISVIYPCTAGGGQELGRITGLAAVVDLQLCLQAGLSLAENHIHRGRALVGVRGHIEVIGIYTPKNAVRQKPFIHVSVGVHQLHIVHGITITRRSRHRQGLAGLGGHRGLDPDTAYCTSGPTPGVAQLCAAVAGRVGSGLGHVQRDPILPGYLLAEDNMDLGILILDVEAGSISTVTIVRYGQGRCQRHPTAEHRHRIGVIRIRFQGDIHRIFQFIEGIELIRVPMSAGGLESAITQRSGNGSHAMRVSRRITVQIIVDQGHLSLIFLCLLPEGHFNIDILYGHIDLDFALGITPNIVGDLGTGQRICNDRIDGITGISKGDRHLQLVSCHCLDGLGCIAGIHRPCSPGISGSSGIHQFGLVIHRIGRIIEGVLDI